MVSRAFCGLTGTGSGVKSNGMDVKHVGVLGVEGTSLVGVVRIVRLAGQRATDDLLAEELRAEGADAPTRA